jgi:hypothetical protein
VRRSTAGVAIFAVHKPAACNDENETDCKPERYKNLYMSDVPSAPFGIRLSLRHMPCPSPHRENYYARCEFQGP